MGRVWTGYCESKNDEITPYGFRCPKLQLVQMADSSRDRGESESASSSKDTRFDASVPPAVKPTRSYRACTNCRIHKTKCDLGDVNNPISPPCSRCKRERKHCEFAESRRGGRANIEAGLAKRKGNSEVPVDSSGAIPREPEAGIDEKKDQRKSSMDHLDTDRRDRFASDAYQREAVNVTGYSGTLPFSRHSGESQMAHGTDGGIDRRYSRVAAYNNDASYIPMFSPPVASVSRPYHNTFSPRAHQTGTQDSPINMGNVDMSFVFSGDHGRQTIKDHGRVEPSAAALPTVAYSGDLMIRGAPTGPVLSEFFASPDALADNSLQQGHGSSRQALLTPQGSAHDQDRNASASKRRKLSTSTTESTRRDKEIKNEKLALEDTRSFVINAGMHNESDALQILAMAAETRNTKKRKRDTSVHPASPHADATEGGETDIGNGPIKGDLGVPEEALGEWSRERGSRTRRRTSAFQHDNGPGASRVTFQESVSEKEDSPALPDITQFFLVEQGIVDPEQVHSLCRAFFDKHHHFFPLIPPGRIPRTNDEINAFAVREPYLVTACIIIASKCQISHSARRIHEQTWNLMKVCLRKLT